MMTAKERYREDPVFHAIVDMLRREMQRGDFTPTELREAVILAATIHEPETVRMLAPALAGLECLQPYLDMTIEEARRASVLDDSPEQARRDAAEEMRERCARHVFEWFDCWDGKRPCVLGGEIRSLPLPGDKT